MEEYRKNFESAVTEDEKKQYAQQFNDYMNLYDIVWEFNVSMKDSKESGWEKIK